ncbi:hypothetical protein RQP46_009762 [Phenoliferia psychrophenolica]
MSPKLSKHELDSQIGELESQLPSDTDAIRRERFRTFFQWAAQQARIAAAVLSLVSTSSYSTLAKVILVVALLSPEGKKSGNDFTSLVNLLIGIFVSFPLLRGALLGSVNHEMDGIYIEARQCALKLSKKTIRWPFSKKKTLAGRSESWTERLKRLQVDLTTSVPRVEHAELVPTSGSLHATKASSVVDGPDRALQRSKASGPRFLHKLERIPLNLQLFGRERDLERTLDRLTKSGESEPSTDHVAILGTGGIGKTSLATQPGESLEKAVRTELSKERLFLILDNLLDSTDTSHTSYLDFIDSLTSIPTLTLLITSRNHTVVNRNTPRTIHPIPLGSLSVDAAEALFRKELGRRNPSQTSSGAGRMEELGTTELTAA